MKLFIKITTALSYLIFLQSCQWFAGKKQANFEFLPLPDMVEAPPDESVKSWVKFDLIGTMNHPFPIIWFSSQKFEREYPNVLIKLEKNEYEQFKLFVRATECEANLDSVHGDPLLRVTEYTDKHQTVRCIMQSTDVCEYATKMFGVPEITWTEKQKDVLERMIGEFDCEVVNNKYQPRKINAASSDRH